MAAIENDGRGLRSGKENHDERELQISGGVDTPIGGGSFSACFSEVSTVEVLGKGSVAMRDLSVGDHILTGNSYQPVYAFAHLDRRSKAEFLRIETDATSSALEITKNHLLYVDGAAAGPVRAGSVKVGDVLSGGAQVTKIDTVQRMGVYAPLTPDGVLLVNGIKASSYVSLPQVQDHALFGGDRVAAFSHFGISPFRLLCNNLALCQSYNQEGIPQPLAALWGFFDWFMAQSAGVQVASIVVYLLVAVVSWTLECVLLMVGGTFSFVGAARILVTLSTLEYFRRRNSFLASPMKSLK